ncbi:MAG: polymer-forming cytoskeletal protein [Bacteroidota bacterium]
MEKENNPQTRDPDDPSENTGSLNLGKGDFSFLGNLVISGMFSGRLNVYGTLILGVNARVTGEVVANDLIIFGQMLGNARIINMVVFHTSSVFSGTVTASEAEVFGGSSISGKRAIGRITEREEVKTRKNSEFNIKDPSSIPDEMTHPFFRL